MSNSGRGSGKLPARASNPKRIAARAASWKRGQERKAERRLAQSKRERANASREIGVLSPWEKVTQGQSEKRNKHYNVGTAKFVVGSPLTKLAKGQMNPGRSVSIGAMLNGKRVETGWAWSCVNCHTHKSYTHEHFQDAYGMAMSAGRDHMCAPQSWKSPFKELLAYAS